MMRRVLVGATSDIPPGSRAVVEVDGRRIGIFNLDGEFHALRDRCPHQGAALCATGEIVGRLEADGPGELRFDSTAAVIQCSWHGWEFDIRTGRSVCSPDRIRMRSFPTEVTREGSGPHDERANVLTTSSIDRPRGSAGPGEELRAETYPVEVEDGSLYVVLRGGSRVNR